MTAARRLVVKILPPLALLALVVALWQLAVVRLAIPAYYLPTPRSVLIAAHEHAGDLASATRLTAEAAVGGFALSLIVGIALALVFSQARWIERAAYPYAIFLQTVPIVAIAPLVALWCGEGLKSVVVVAFIISLFPILASATTGLTTIDSNLLDLFKMSGASRWQTLFKLRLPSALPYLVTGAKTSCGLSVIGAIVGETAAGGGMDQLGLGYLIMLTKSQLITDYAFAALAASTLLGIVMFAAVSIAGNWLLAHWRMTPPDRRGAA